LTINLWSQKKKSKLKHLISTANIVFQVFSSDQMQLYFTRQIVELYFKEWSELNAEFQHFVLHSCDNDTLQWRWNSKGRFSVHFLYNWLEYCGFKNTKFSVLWRTNISLKIKIFVWLVRKNRVLTKLNLQKKGWNENVRCMFCAADHLFVTCLYISSIWKWIALFNNFSFERTTVEDLWDLDCSIPLKNQYVVELIRGPVVEFMR
jgi:zinc-binding in reverse transcriptase